MFIIQTDDIEILPMSHGPCVIWDSHFRKLMFLQTGGSKFDTAGSYITYIRLVAGSVTYFL